MKTPVLGGSGGSTPDVLVCPCPPVPSCTPRPVHAGQGQGLPAPSRATGATFVCLSGCFSFWANAQFNCTSFCVIPVQSCSKIPTSTPFPFRSLQSPFCLISTVISRAELRFLPFRPQALSDAAAAEINPHPEQSRNDLLQVEAALFPSRLIYQPLLRPLRSAEARERAGESGGDGIRTLGWFLAFNRRLWSHWPPVASGSEVRPTVRCVPKSVRPLGLGALEMWPRAPLASFSTEIQLSKSDWGCM